MSLLRFMHDGLNDRCAHSNGAARSFNIYFDARQLFHAEPFLIISLSLFSFHYVSLYGVQSLILYFFFYWIQIYRYTRTIRSGHLLAWVMLPPNAIRWWLIVYTNFARATHTRDPREEKTGADCLRINLFALRDEFRIFVIAGFFFCCLMLM